MNISRFSIFTTVLALAVGTAQAQDAATSSPTSTDGPATPSRHQDIGLFLQSGGALQSGEGESSFQGFVYRRARRAAPHVFWKIGLGFGGSFTSNYGYSRAPIADTSYTVFYETRQRAVQALAGVETQRKLWKSIFLTAGLEAQAGGGSGTVDSSTQTTFGASGGGNSAIFNAASHFADVRTYFGAGLGSIGIRSYQGRFTIALDVLAGISVSMRSQTIARVVTDGPRNFSIFNFDLLGTSPRLSVGYRF